MNKLSIIKPSERAGLLLPKELGGVFLQGPHIISYTDIEQILIAKMDHAPVSDIKLELQTEVLREKFTV